MTLIVGPPGRAPSSTYIASASTPTIANTSNAASITFHSQIDGTHWDATVTYDFSTSGQINDWTALNNTTLGVTGGVATCTVSGSPSNNIIGMRSNFNVVPSRIDYVARNLGASLQTINIYCNVTTFDGSNYVAPSPAHGMTYLWSGAGRLFVVNGAEQSSDNNGGMSQNTWTTSWHTWSTTQMQNYWSQNGATVTYTGALTLNDARILVGGYQNSTEWDSIVIRGVFTTS